MAPQPGEVLILYLPHTDKTISSVLIVERKEAQIPIYFVSRTQKGPEERYSPIKNLVLSLIYTARKLRRYFQAHVIRVLTDKHLQRILMKPEISGRLAKWAIELGDHTIEYKPRVAFKGQVKADFLTEAQAPENEKPMSLEDHREVVEVKVSMDLEDPFRTFT
ncbi:uncharacterized protein LOC143568232 [Bidens hawaiensis]|uniref:uncharacterized protein LOC143568232 n=1 Tax=Bidens hawaiensis TaxID=980011 RepID=UPI00404B2BC0